MQGLVRSYVTLAITEVGFAVLTAVTMKSAVFWFVVLCISERAEYIGSNFRSRSDLSTKGTKASGRPHAFSKLHGVKPQEKVFFILNNSFRTWRVQLVQRVDYAG
jgi:hypothetical protein